MNAQQVRAYIEAKYPNAMQSPMALAMGGASAMALLEASDADAVITRAEIRADALAHAEACLRSRDGWTVEALGHNIESAFGMDLDNDECDEIAVIAITNMPKAEQAGKDGE